MNLSRLAAPAALIFAISSTALAAPTVTGTSGTLSHGSSLVITGTGFGTKSAAAPWRWDPVEGVSYYEGLSDGDAVPVSTGGYWDDNSSNLIKYNTAADEQRGVSTRNLNTIDGSTNCPSAEDNKKLGVTMPSSSERYVSFWIWHSTTLTDEFSKTVRLWDEYRDGTNRLSIVDSWGPNGPWHASRLASSSTCYASPALGRAFGTDNFVRPIAGEWERVEFYIKQESAPDTSDDGRIWLAQTANGNISMHDSGVISESCNGVVSNLNWLTFGFDKNCSGAGATSVMDIRLDDIYIDDTQARVEIGDGATWSANNHREVQVPSSWSSGSVTITLNQGSFSSFNNLYLYIVDSDGNVNTNGYPLCPHCPKPPNSLEVD